MREPQADPLRYEKDEYPKAGIPFRGKKPDGSYGSVDLNHLDTESVLHFMRNNGGWNPRAEATVLMLLGHDSERAYEKPEEDTVQGWHEVISIFGSYLDPGQSLPVTGGHDKVWIGVDPEKVSDKHKARLSELGWDDDEEGHASFSSYQNS